MVCFFFSSRRRHTRFDCDWSSDVCSSDLALTKLGLLNEDLDYHLIRASMVLLFLFFGYQKWFEYEAQVLMPYISNGPLISWMYPMFGIRGASWFLGVSEWSSAVLLFLGFWYKRLGSLGALGSCGAFLGTVTIIPFMPDGWAASAGGFPAMAGGVAVLLKGVGPFAGLVRLLEDELRRAAASAPEAALGPAEARLKETGWTPAR